MNLTSQDLETLLQAALEAARLAAHHIRIESQGNIEVMRKQGGNTEASQVLTEVDLASERILLDSLQPTMSRYHLGLLTEETEDDSSRHEADYFWCIDPIDGTLPFIKGEAGYSVVIALVDRAGTSWLGVIHDVVADTTYHAIRGSGAHQNGVRVNPALTKHHSKLRWFMDSSMRKHSRFDDWKKALHSLAVSKGLSGLEIIDHAGAALNACWMASASPSVYFKCPKKEDGGGSVWDFAASSCYCEALSLPVSDIYGDPLHLNPNGSTFMNQKGVLYASSVEWSEEIQSLHAELS